MSRGSVKRCLRAGVELEFSFGILWPFGVTGLDALRALVIENIDWIVPVTRTSLR